MRCAVAMRAAGWWPHQTPASWDRVEDGSAAGAPLQGALARRAAALAAEAAEDAPRVMSRLTPEERTRGGVDPLEAIDDHALAQPQPNPPYTRTSGRDRAPLYGAVTALVAAGVLEEGEVRALGRVFLGTGGRLLLDPEWVNSLIPHHARATAYGRMEDLLEGGARYAVKADLKAAFNRVPVAEHRRRYLGVCVDGVLLRYARLPFGLATSPRYFGAMLQRSMETVPRLPGAAISVYVDDIGVAARDPMLAADQLIRVLTTLREDGWRLAVGKTFLRPTTTIIFLGWALDLPARAAALTARMRDKAARWAEDAPRSPGVLRKLLGMASWARRALRASGFVVPTLWKVANGAPWDDDAAECLRTLMQMVRAAATPVPLDPPTRLIPVVTDASDGAWAYALLSDGAVQRMGRGSLPSHARGWSSTAREAAAVVATIKEIEALGESVADALVVVSTDSASLAHILRRSATRSVEVAHALSFLVEKAAQGLSVTAHWVRRSEGLQPLVDSATAEVRSWHPPAPLRTFVDRYCGPFDLHIGAGERRHAMADRFTSLDPGGARSITQARLAATWTGWVGLDYEGTARGRRVVAHPEWGREPDALRRLREAKTVTLFLRLSRASPELLDTQRDVFRSVGALRPPEGLRRWVATELGGPENVAGNLSVPDLHVVTWSRLHPTSAQIEAEAHLRAALAQALHPGPGDPMASADAAFFAEITRRRRAIAATPETEEHDVRPATLAGRPRTLRDWLEAIAQDAVVMGAVLSPAAEAYAAEVAASLSVTRRRTRGRQPRAAGAATRMLRLAEALSTSSTVATEAAWDALAYCYVASRVGGRVPSPVDWGGFVQPATVRDELSAVAEALRTRGAVVPAYLGPRTAGYLRARGAFQRVEASNALPLSLRWLMGVEPQPGSPDHPIWASRMCQAGFVLRPGMAGSVRKGNLVPWGPGYVLVWVVRDKTRTGDQERPEAPLGQWRVSACGHPAVAAAIATYHSRAASERDLLFPTATPQRVLAWLRRTRQVSPDEVPRLTAHGFRTAADTELLELGAPPDWINALGHWARAATPGRTSQAYYGSLDLGKLMLLTSRLGGVAMHHPAPGVHVSIESPGPVDWEEAWRSYRTRLPTTPPGIRESVAAMLVEEEEDEEEGARAAIGRTQGPR